MPTSKGLKMYAFKCAGIVMLKVLVEDVLIPDIAVFIAEKYPKGAFV
jgi:hypothetical protein